ncbi:MAG: hypothetical protein ACYCT6_08895 [bacterium]
MGWAELIIIGVIALIVYLSRKSSKEYKKECEIAKPSDSFFSPSGESNEVDEYLGFGGPTRSLNPNYMIYKELRRANELRERELNQSGVGNQRYSVCDWANEENKEPVKKPVYRKVRSKNA